MAERGVDVIAGALGVSGPLTREQLRERLDAAGVPTAGQALVHLLMLASLRGLVIRGPMVDGRHAFVLVRDWLGEIPAVDPDRALAELARRYLAGHGPSSDRDLAAWAGVTLGAARAGLQAIASELSERPGGLVDLTARGPAAAIPPPRLLGPFDALLHGWVKREFVLGEHTDVVTINGLFRPIALVNGRAAGIWSLPGGRVDLKPFGRIARADRAALDAEADDVVRFLGLA